MNISEIPFSSIQQIRIGHWEDAKGGTDVRFVLRKKGRLAVLTCAEADPHREKPSFLNRHLQ